MDVPIDPLLVLEQIISTNDSNPSNAEVPEAEYYDSINSLAEKLITHGETSSKSGENILVSTASEPTQPPVPIVEMFVDVPTSTNVPLASSTKTSLQAADPLAVMDSEAPTSSTEPIPPAPGVLPSAPDFSFMDLVAEPPESPVIILGPPPLLTYGQNNNAGAVRSASSLKPPLKKQVARKTNTLTRPHASSVNMQFRAKLMANIKQLASVSQREQAYRHKLFPDETMVRRKQMDCTICGIHIGCRVGMNVACVTHPLLKVLICPKCKASYMQADWTLGPQGRDKRCRWCSKTMTRSNNLRNCSECPFAFCQSCISRNFSKTEWELTRSTNHWICYACQMIPFYLSRAVCWAISRFINSPSLDESRGKDLSMCCPSPTSSAALQSVATPKIPEVLPGINGAHQQKKFDWVKTRVHSYFIQLDSIKTHLTARMNQTPVTYQEKATAVEDIVTALTNIAGTTSSTSNAIHNWLRLQETSSANGTSPMTVLSTPSNQTRGFSIPKQIRRKRPSPTLQHNETPKKCSQLPPKRPTLTSSVPENSSLNYDELVKKFNIKPCYVLLERWNWSEPCLDLTDLLVPKVELKVVGTDDSQSPDYIVID